MFYYFFGGLVLLSYGQYFWKRYVVKQRKKTADKLVQTMVECASILKVSEPNSPMSVSETSSENIVFDYKTFSLIPIRQ